MSKWDEERIAELMKKRVKMGQTPPAPRPSLAAQEPIGKILSEEEMGIGYDRKSGDVLWWAKPKGPAMLFAAPPPPTPSLAAQDDCLTCHGDPVVCASIPGLRHCEKVMREPLPPTPASGETPRTD